MTRGRRGARALGVVLAAGLALAGCGAQAVDDTPGNQDVATGGRLFGTADSETAKLGSDAAPGVFPRTVRHAMGETRLETRPQRIVVLDTGELDSVVSLGVTPVGIAFTEGSPAAPAYLPVDVSAVPTVGTTAQLNLEAVAAADPDLILGSQLRAQDLYPQLAAIAPTVFSIRPGFPWKENLLLISAAMGTESAATELLNRYQQRATEVGDAVPDDPLISIVRFRPAEIRLYGNYSFIGVILADAGLRRPPIQDVDELAVEISAERISEADGDWLFYSSYGSPESTDEQTVTAGPLWPRLGAVTAGRSARVNDDIWFLALGPSGAMTLLDELQTALAAGGAS